MKPDLQATSTVFIPPLMHVTAVLLQFLSHRRWSRLHLATELGENGVSLFSDLGKLGLREGVQGKGSGFWGFLLCLRTLSERLGGAQGGRARYWMCCKAVLSPSAVSPLMVWSWPVMAAVRPSWTRAPPCWLGPAATSSTSRRPLEPHRTSLAW